MTPPMIEWRYHVHALRADDPADTLEMLETFTHKRPAFEYARAAARRNQEFTSITDTMARRGATRIWVLDPKTGTVAKTVSRGWMNT